MEISQRISKNVYEEWFLGEPALYAVLCSHELRENLSIPIAVRCGRGMLEYNPKIADTLTNKELQESFKAEVIRIMLKHPYQRQPECKGYVRTIASNIVLTNENYFKHIALDKAEDFSFPKTEYFEWYISKLASQSDSQSSNNQSDNSNDDDNGGGMGSGDNSDDKNENGASQEPSENDKKTSQSQLWEENDFEASRVNEIIENITTWGTLPGDLVEKIKTGVRGRIDYRKVLSGFRASVISSRRNLTRMRPNRRTNFQNLGSVYKMRTNLLVAVDVSGSVSYDMLAYFYSVINKFFKYGVESIDTMQFDAGLGEVLPLKKAQKEIKITGRGGTDFQIVFDFYRNAKTHYDGLIIFTDGYAPTPKISGKRPKVLWIFPDRKCEETNSERLRTLGRCCVIER